MDSSNSGHFDIFRWLPEEAQADFNQSATRRRYVQNELIYSRGDHSNYLFRVAHGLARVSTIRADGRELVYLFMQSGDTFGGGTLLDGGPVLHNVEAASDTELQVINRSAFLRLRAAYPIFNEALLQLSCRHVRLLSGLLDDAHLASVTARLASRLAAFAFTSGTPAGEGVRLSTRLSQTELGLLIGCSRQSANKALHQLKNEGLLELEGNSITVTSLPKLVQRVGVD